MRRTRRRVAWILAVLMAVVLAACGGEHAADSPAAGEATSAVEAGASDATAGLFGKPWVTSIVQGNLPAERPDVKDDLYTHYAYDYLKDHQDTGGIAQTDYASELQATAMEAIADTSKTDHDLEQLRILYSQASDFETLKQRELSEVQPYLDRIDAVTSIVEMNELLSSDDFPFSPFVLANLALTDTRGVNVVQVSANLALVDPVMVGGALYQDTDDEQTQASMEAALRAWASEPMADLVVAGWDQEKIDEAFELARSFEQAHGACADYGSKYVQEDFGAMAEAARDSTLTLDELCAACPTFPMRETLEALGKGSAPTYVSDLAWLEAFGNLWSDDNIEAIKLIARMKVLSDTRPYRDPTGLWELEGEADDAAAQEAFAYEACNQLDTLSIVLAQTYVDEALGEEAKPRITKLTEEIIDTYKELVGPTAWMSDESRQRVIDKLDHMTLNILEPTGGYYDFSGVELTPTEAGGTLFQNYLKLRQYRLDQESQMVGAAAVPAYAWHWVRPTEMNAFYSPTSNSIDIFPGYVTSLIYADDMSDTDLLASIGFVLGHEISHGFDYQGAQFDGYGAPNPVFADADVDAFVLKCSSLALYYQTIEVAPDTMADGENTVAEAASDLSGLQAVLELLARNNDADLGAFFRRFSNLWAQVISEEQFPSLLVDSHPLANLRVNVNAQMMDALYDALGVSEGDAMYLAPEQRIVLWGEGA